MIFLGIVAITYLSGNLTPVAGVVFGFIVFGMIFMGMMSVLPTGITHPAPAPTGTGFFNRAGSLLGRMKGRVHESSTSWMSSNSVEVRHPKYR
jgi:hypothetical protein